MSEEHIEAAARLAAELLAPSAAEVEREGVPRTHLDAIAKAGLLGLAAPSQAGGSAAPQRVIRTVKEILAGACLTTWFVQAQHHKPVAVLAASDAPLRDELLPKLATGELIAGMASAHVRRFPDRPVVAERVTGGWRFSGSAPWYTGWTLNDVALIAGVDDDMHVVWAIIEAVPQPGLRASEPMQTVAVAGALTVRLDLDGLWVSDHRVVARVAFAAWQAGDRVQGADVRPAVFGVTAAALGVLASADEPEAARLARVLRRRLDEVRTRCYSLADGDPHGRLLEERRAARADAYAVLAMATTAAVAAGGGRAVTPDAPAGRLARAGLFLLVQAQTEHVRAATLRRWHDLAATPPR
ncbi:MAG: acyl-CoA dehydrogenase family protein [Pseudonocardiaceae bacterium]